VRSSRLCADPDRETLPTPSFVEAPGRVNSAEVPLRTGRVRSFAHGRFHDIAYVDWGDQDSPHVVVCVHGLSRQGRDFDPLAKALARLGYRVVCPDLAGRGRSGWLKDPEAYGLPQYAVDMAMLIARLGVERLDWVGTSLGGLVGMVLAGARGSPIRRFVINDIGPLLPWAPVRAIGARLREAPLLYTSLETAERRLREVHASFGPLTDTQWQHLTRFSFVPEPKGGWRPHYDPSIGNAFRPGRVYNVSMWRDWDAITCPVLLLRGMESDLLLVETADEMTRRGPRAERVDIPGCGHAPALLHDDQIRIVTDWLGSPR
jgi:pimeloyl-ACP methyl ester carboxylesterase